MTNIKCFLGVIGSGKDFQANKLVQKGYTQVNFADELYIQVGKILGIDLEDRTDREYFKLVYPDARQILQNYGNLRREEEPEYWASKWADRIDERENENYACSDVRFINELQTVLSFEQEIGDMEHGVYHFWYDIEFIFCNYPSYRYDSTNEHSSEKLAQRILKDGYKDGDILSHEYLKGLIENGI